MNEIFKWQKIKKKDFKRAQEFLIDIEEDYVSACAKFLGNDKLNDPAWILSGKNDEIAGFVINSKSAILPALRGGNEIPPLVFLKSLMRAKKIHSVQGLQNEVRIFESEIEKIGGQPADIIDYDLMTLETPPKRAGKISNSSSRSNFILRVPQMIDIDGMAPLQAAYEKEEVLPKGSVFNPAASRINTANLIAGGKILAAEVGGRLVGKINVNAVSFTRYQVGGVYVDPDYRRRGIAKKMAAEFIASLTGEGKGVTLFVRKTNDAARRLYSGLGFKKLKDYRITYY